MLRRRARRMLAAALELEVDEHLSALRGEVADNGRRLRLQVRNGRVRPRMMTTAAGAVPIRAHE